jgi:uncharacterized damage-inducible protein DinB
VRGTEHVSSRVEKLSASIDVPRLFLKTSRELLTRDFLPKIERCLDELGDEDVWWRPNEQSNSIGNLVLHLCGNVSQWIVAAVGGRSYDRHRQQEFDERRVLPRRELLERIQSAVREAGVVIASVDPDALLARRRIQGYDVTVLEAIYHVVEHFSMHTGQIILITKARTGKDLKLWEPPKADGSA